ncbi:MAG: DEAD/DEAH box helicase [Planctomycetes bacterium]|nr:DEAD/DEAH box helicase [Planctomycetota bacterium]
MNDRSSQPGPAGRPRPFGEGLGLPEDERAKPARERTRAPARRKRGDAQPVELPSDAIRSWRGFQLSPFQVEAVAAIRGGHNVLVSAPTGAGKTLVAEYAIHDAVERKRRVVYTTPIKALSNQKYRDFRAVPGMDVGLMTGDVTIHPGAQVRIMTTEILRNAIFENPEELSDVEYVIFDEVHYMDDLERGSVWEESLIFAPSTIRFVCLSATISNAEELGAWLREIRGPDVVVIQSSKRPVPLHNALYSARSGIFELGELDRVRKREVERAGRTNRGPKHQLKAGGGRPRRGFGNEMTEVPPIGPLLDDLQERNLLPTLVFAFSRKDCERLALANSRRELLDARERARMDELQEELLKLFQLGPEFLHSELLQMARRGLSYHHAGMLPIHKELVERMFTSGLLKLLFTTETFALGINMPARTVVFYTLRKFDGISFDYMSTRDYMQMAGRAGRQGIDAEGLVFSLLSPRDLVEAPVQRLFGGHPEPVESRFRLSFSSLLHLVARLGRARVPEAWEKSFDQYQHRVAGEKQERKNRREQARVLEAHLACLDELGYLHGDTLTPRGQLARKINGYELQITELVFRGTLENLSVEALGVIFVGLIFEERRRNEETFVSSRLHGNVRTNVSRELHALRMQAGAFGLMESIKKPDWGMTAPLVAWIEGKRFEELEELTEATPGDVVRTFRLAQQLARQLRRAIDPKWDLHEKLGLLMEAINRDEVDARRQLELG